MSLCHTSIFNIWIETQNKVFKVRHLIGCDFLAFVLVNVKENRAIKMKLFRKHFKNCPCLDELWTKNYEIEWEERRWSGSNVNVSCYWKTIFTPLLSPLSSVSSAHCMFLGTDNYTLLKDEQKQTEPTARAQLYW